MIFDCHVHLPSPGLQRAWEWQPFTPDLAAAVRYLRRCGVDRAIANSMRGELAKTPEEMVAGNDESARAAEQYPDMLVPACLINADLGQEALAEIRRCRGELGMVWVGESYLPADRLVSGFSLVLTVWAGVLMVSNFRYYSFKGINWKGKVPFVAMLLVVLILVLVSSNPPLMLFTGFLIYSVSGIVMTLLQMRKRRAERKAQRRAESQG